MADNTLSLDRALHAVTDPTRRRILAALKHHGQNSKAPTQARPGVAAAQANGLCAGDIEEHVRLSQPTVSHHMAILARAGLVLATKQGQWRWYRRNEKAVRQLLKKLKAEL